MICSVNLYQFLNNLPIEKIELEGLLDGQVSWKVLVPPLKGGEQQCFLQSPVLSLSPVFGTIGIKLAVFFDKVCLAPTEKDGVSSTELPHRHVTAADRSESVSQQYTASNLHTHDFKACHRSHLK